MYNLNLECDGDLAVCHCMKGEGFDVMKSGDARVALIGFPSVGKVFTNCLRGTEVSGHFYVSLLWRCWLGGRKGIRPIKTEWCAAGVVICLERGADLHMAQLMSLPLTVSCFSKIQIGFTFLVPAHPGSPGKRAVKHVCVRALSIFQCFNTAGQVTASSL